MADDTAIPGVPLVSPHPVRLEIDYPAQLSRWRIILVKYILAIPHFICIGLLGIGAAIALLLSGLSILFTGNYPRGLFDYLVGVQRWSHRVAAYALTLQTDQYPPFSLEDDPSYPVRLNIDYHPRVFNLRFFYQIILAYPALMAASFIMFAAELYMFIAWFAILFTGRYPVKMFTFVTKALRFQLKTVAYAYWMTPQYPIELE
jgi:hypothetical protein